MYRGILCGASLLLASATYAQTNVTLNFNNLGTQVDAYDGASVSQFDAGASGTQATANNGYAWANYSEVGGFPNGSASNDYTRMMDTAFSAQGTHGMALQNLWFSPVQYQAPSAFGNNYSTSAFSSQDFSYYEPSTTLTRPFWVYENSGIPEVQAQTVDIIEEALLRARSENLRMMFFSDLHFAQPEWTWQSYSNWQTIPSSRNEEICLFNIYFIKWLASRHGVPIHAISVQNEPNRSERHNYSNSQMATLAQVMRQKLDEAGMHGVKVIPGTWHPQELNPIAYYFAQGSGTSYQQYYDIFGHHMFGTQSHNSYILQMNNTRYWATSGSYNAWARDGGASGNYDMGVASNMDEIARVNSWHVEGGVNLNSVWQLFGRLGLEAGGFTTLSSSFQPNSTGNPDQRKNGAVVNPYVRPGMFIVGGSQGNEPLDQYSVDGFGGRGHRPAIVISNHGSSRSFSIATQNSGASSWEVYQADPSKFKTQLSNISGSNINITVPANSVTTLVGNSTNTDPRVYLVVQNTGSLTTAENQIVNSLTSAGCNVVTVNQSLTTAEQNSFYEKRHPIDVQGAACYVIGPSVNDSNMGYRYRTVMAPVVVYNNNAARQQLSLNWGARVTAGQALNYRDPLDPPSSMLSGGVPLASGDRAAVNTSVSALTDEVVWAVNNSGATDVVIGSGDTSPTITTTSLPSGVVSNSYSQTLQASGGDGSLSWSVISGNLPSGLSLSSGGSITGTPTTEGTSYFTVEVEDADSDSDTQNLSIEIIDAGNLTLTLNRDYWTGVSGTNVADLTGINDYPGNPDGSDEISGGFQAVGWSGSSNPGGTSNWAESYGERIYGYLVPPTTGSYTFWISSDDSSDLYLSTDSDPGNASRIAYVDGWTNSQEWNKYTSQKSSAISLTAGEVYYIEAIHKEGASGDNLAVGWARPGQGTTSPSEVVPNTALSSYSAGVPGGGGDTSPVISTTNLPNGQVGSSYSATLNATGGDGTLTWSVISGSLPSGLSLSSGGTISGTPTTQQTANFTVEVEDADSDTDTQPLSITINAASSWSGQDVGSVSAAGSFSENSGTFTIDGSGEDIWGSSDEFYFVTANNGLSGDGSITARVVSTDSIHAWQKVGVMIRNGTAANAQHAMTAVTLSNGVVQQYRTTTGGSSGSNAGSGSAPYWVRLVRSGNTFTSYASSNGTSWTQIGSQSISMPTNVEIGLCVTSHQDGTLCTAEIDNVTISGGSGGSQPSITTSSLPNGSVGNSYNQTLQASGGDGTLSWSVISGSLPAGLSLSSGGSISGTPSSTGTSNFTVEVEDTDNDTDTQALSITITSGGGGTPVTLASWDLLAAGSTSGNATSVAATSTDSDVSTGNLSRGSGFPSGSLGAYADRGAFNTTNSASPSSLSAAKSSSTYCQWSISPDSGQSLSLEELNLYGYSQDNNGYLVVEYSTDGFSTSGTAVGSPLSLNSGWTGVSTSLDLSGESALQGTSNTVTFRAYIYGAGGYTSRGIGQEPGNNDDIEIVGSVQ